MHLSDQLFIIKNRMFEKRNIIMIIVLIIIFLVFFTCLTIMQFSVLNKKEILNSEISRSFLITDIDKDDELFQSLKKIEHIELIDNIKYNGMTIFDVEDFNVGNEKGIISVKALLMNQDIELMNGKVIEQKNDIICSDTFYPHFYDERIYSNLFVSHNKILDKSFVVISQNEDFSEKEITLKIVGTYKNKYMEEANTCYTSKETYDELSSKYAGYSESYDENGNLIKKEHIEYNDYFIRIDSNNNIDQVLEQLEKVHINYERIFFLDSGFLNMLYTIPLIVGIVIMIITFIILYSFINKKNNNRIHNIGILKASGYQEKDIICLAVNENLLIIFISCFISIIIYSLLMVNLRYTLLAEVTYNSYILSFPIFFIVVSIMLLVLFSVIAINKSFKNIFKLDIKQLLEG